MTYQPNNNNSNRKIFSSLPPSLVCKTSSVIFNGECCGKGETTLLIIFIYILIYLYKFIVSVQFSSVQLLSSVWLFATPRSTAHQASLSITSSQGLLKLRSIESVMPSNHLILCHPLLLLPYNLLKHQGLFKWVSSSQQVGKVLEFQLHHQSFQWMNTQDWSPLGWTGWIILQSKGLSTVFCNTTVQKHQFFCTQLSSQSNSHIHTWPEENHSLD